MDWLNEVQEKKKRKNQILFTKSSECLQGLSLLLAGQDHRAVTVWALELAGEAAKTLEARYPDDLRPRNTVETARLWAQGAVKMPVAKGEILRCHAMAKALASPEDAALCHAVGQGCSVIHTAGHALGFPIYELTALVLRYGVEGCKDPVEARVREYEDRLLYWSAHYPEAFPCWAAFLQ